MKKLLLIAIIYFFFPLAAKAATDFVAVVDPGNGADTDYTSLAAWENSFGIIDLTANTLVFTGTTTGTLSDGIIVYQCRGGAYQTASGTMTHDTATQALIKNITAGASFSAYDIWYTNETCNSASYFQIGNTGDSPVAVAKCRTSTGAADTAAVVIDGWTTSATNYIKVWTDPSENYRHQGVWDERKYRLEPSSAQNTLYNYEDYVKVDGLQIKLTYNSGTDITVYLRGNYNYASNNLVTCNLSSTAVGYGIVVESDSFVWNNIIYGFNNNSNGYGIRISAVNTQYIYNNTVANNYIGINRNAGTAILKNNIAYNNTTNYSGTFDTASTNDITNNTPSSASAFGASADSGTTDATTANKLVDSDQNFLTTVKVGMIIKNTTDTTYTYVTAVDSNSTLSVANDYFTSGETYTIYTNMYGSPTFEDEANYDFHLDSSDTVAKNKGANLYADANLAITTDIDNNARPNSATTFDIGADENVARIYRSVGPSATTAVIAGTSNYQTNHLSISSTTATFELPLPDNVGVGDAIQYDANADGSITAADGIAFIDKRYSAQKFRIKKADGTAPTAMAIPDIDWSLFRAYTSLANAIDNTVGGTENTGIDSDLRNFDTFTGHKDLTTNNEQWNIACYANGTTADTAATYLYQWTTSADDYMRIYTPTAINEVGTSQRHAGIWATSKYYLEVTDARPIYIEDTNYIRIDGLQALAVNPTAVNRSLISRAWNVTINNEMQVSNCLLKGHNSGTYFQQGIADNDADAIAKIWNNIIFNFNNTLATGNQIGIYSQGTKANIYNNVVIGSYTGIGSGGNAVAKNNIVKGNNGSAFNGTFAAGSGYNATDKPSMGVTYIVTGGAVGDRTSQTFSFVDEANFDYHLAPGDTGAKNYGADLSNDPYLPINTDIDSSGIGYNGKACGLAQSNVTGNGSEFCYTRPRGTTFDIGADEVITKIYRSVGPGEDEVLETGASNHLNISGSTATFDTALGDDIGVGDVLEYDDDNDGDIDASDSIAFITGRTDSTHYTIKTATGGVPTAPSAADEIHWNINRAYKSLANWETGTENTLIDSDLRAFDAGNRDIKANSEQWNVACYAHGTTADTAVVSIGGWTTSPTNYIRVYTPYLTSEVGTSQRHSGKWDDNKYHMAVNTNIDIVSVFIGYAWIDGIQVDRVGAAVNFMSNIYSYPSTQSTHKISNNIVRNSNLVGTNLTGIGVQASGGNLFVAHVYNNIAYGFNLDGSYPGAVASAYLYGRSGSTIKLYLYNNTSFNSNKGFFQFEAMSAVIAKNNIAQNCLDGFYGTFDSSSDYNLSDLASDAPGSHSRNSTAVTFADETNNDFHLASTDTGAKDYGADLSQDPVWQMMTASSQMNTNLSQMNTNTNGTDVDMAGRPLAGSGLAWDIGADEAATTIYRSVGPGATSALATGTGNNLSISGSTATFGSSVEDTNAVGVGDAIQYDSDNNGSIDAIALITGRTSGTSWTIKSAVGGTPIPTTAADQDWSIFRSYTGLYYAEKGDENSGLSDAIENFDDWVAGGKDTDDGGRDLVKYNEQWNIAAYANGSTADTDPVGIYGWTTSGLNYLKIYTPTAYTETGISQRHQGKWDGSKYRLDITSTNGNQSFAIYSNYVRVDGLQIQISTSAATGGSAIYFLVNNQNSAIQISNNIIKAGTIFPGTTNITGINYSAAHTYNVYILNNIIFGFTTGLSGYAIHSYSDTGYSKKYYIYNNTFVNNYYGIYSGSARDIFYAKNNIVKGSGNTNAYVGTFDSSSDYNSTDGTDSTDGGAHSLRSQTFTFEDEANYDFHLSAADIGARNNGINLSADAYLPLTADIDGNTRPFGTGWDIGADEVLYGAKMGGGDDSWLTDGLVGYWKMDENSGTVVADSSGNGNNGTLTNAQESLTAEAASTATTVVDSDNASLSTTNDAYNGMWLFLSSRPGGCNLNAFGGDDYRQITDYDGTTKTFTVAAQFYSGNEADSCVFEIRHQAEGKFGNGLRLDGINDYINAGHSSLLADVNNVTYSAWINPSVTPASLVRFFDKRYKSLYLDSDNKIHFWISNNIENMNIACDTAVSLNAWTHVAITWDGTIGQNTNTKIYLNGNRCSTLASAWGQGTVNSESSSDLSIGSLYDGSAGYFSGKIDEARIYNRIFYPDEVEKLYKWAPGPIAKFKMDDNVTGNGKTVNDSSGYGNSGTTDWGANISGMDCTKNGKYNGACEFDGTDDIIETPNSESIKGKGTVTASAWIKTSDIKYNLITSRYGLDTFYFRVSNTGYLSFYVAQGQTLRGDISTIFVADGKWHFVSAVYDGYKTYYYLDGVNAYTKDFGSYFAMGSSDVNQYLTVGGNTAYSTSYFKGLIDDVRVYNYARTSEQIMADMTASTEATAGQGLAAPIAYWNFDEGYGTVAHDSAVSGLSRAAKNLTVSAATRWTNDGRLKKAYSGADNMRVYDNADDNELDFASTTDFSLSAWIKYSIANPAATQYIIHKQAGNEGYALYMNSSGQAGFGIGDTLSASFPEDAALSTADYADNAWHHILGRKTGNSKIELFVDSKLVGSDTLLAANSTLENAGTFYIGDANATDGTDEFLGYIDEVKVYNYALAESQIATDYNNGSTLSLGSTGGPQTSAATSSNAASLEYCVPGSTDYCVPPVGEWKMDMKSGATLFDSSGNGYNGSFGSSAAAPAWAIGKFGNGLRMDGNDTVNFGNVLNIGTSDQSISAWIKFKDQQPDSYSGVHYAQLAGKGILNNRKGFGICLGDEKIAGQIRNLTTVSEVVNTTTSNDGKWHYTTLTVDRDSTTGLKLYIDGKLINSADPTALNGVDLTEATTFTIGYMPDGNAYHYNGIIDQVRVYNYARTPAQIAWEYDKGKPVAEWRFNECQGSIIHDESGNGNHGTINLGASGQTAVGICTANANTAWYNGRTGKYGASLNFDGTNDYVNVGAGSQLNITGSIISISAWIKPDSFGGGLKGRIFDKSNGGDGYVFYVNNDGYTGYNAFSFSPNNTNIVSSKANSISLGDWQHVAVVYTDNKAYFYINGILDSSPSLTYSIPDTSAVNGAIGNRAADLARAFDGLIDNVAIFNYALTAEQVKTLYNNSSAVYFGP